MKVIKNSNLVSSFLLELLALVVLGAWGFMRQSNMIIRVAFGLLAPTLMAVIWSIWCAPSSSHRLEGLSLFALKGLLFGIVTACLLSMKQPSAAIVFGLSVILNLGFSSYFGTL